MMDVERLIQPQTGRFCRYFSILCAFMSLWWLRRGHLDSVEEDSFMNENAKFTKLFRFRRLFLNILSLFVLFSNIEA